VSVVVIGAFLGLVVIVSTLVWLPPRLLNATLRRLDVRNDVPTLIAEVDEVDGDRIATDSASITVAAGSHELTVTCRSTESDARTTRKVTVTLVAGEEYSPYVKVDRYARPCVPEVRQLMVLRY